MSSICSFSLQAVSLPVFRRGGPGVALGDESEEIVVAHQQHGGKVPCSWQPSGAARRERRSAEALRDPRAEALTELRCEP